MASSSISKRAPTKNLMLFSGRAHPVLAQEVADLLEIDLVPTTAYDFANGEIYVRFEESVRGCDAFIMQSHAAPINDAIMEQLLMIDALKRASAKRITVILPFYGYARQDKKHLGREPISARLMADLFLASGADRLMTVDLHTAQIQGFFDGPVDHLLAMPILTRYVKRKYGKKPLAVVSPDAGRIKVAESWASALGEAPLAFIHKTRDETKPNETKANRVVGEVEGRVCILVDDLIDTGGTIVQAAEALMADGAEDVVIVATHAVFSGPAVDRLKNSTACEVIVTNTLAAVGRPALRQAHGALDRSAAGPGHRRGVRRRLRHQPVQELSAIKPERVGQRWRSDAASAASHRWCMSSKPDGSRAAFGVATGFCVTVSRCGQSASLAKVISVGLADFSLRSGCDKIGELPRRGSFGP